MTIQKNDESCDHEPSRDIAQTLMLDELSIEATVSLYRAISRAAGVVLAGPLPNEVAPFDFLHFTGHRAAQEAVRDAL